jgi:hypothetical protein
MEIICTVTVEDDCFANRLLTACGYLRYRCSPALIIRHLHPCINTLSIKDEKKIGPKYGSKQTKKMIVSPLSYERAAVIPNFMISA